MISCAKGASTRIAIVICINDRFVPPAQALIESIHHHGGDLKGVSLVVLTRSLNSNSVRALEGSTRRASIGLSIRVVSDISELGSVAEWAVPTCLRLYVGDYCSDFERALYLDSDLIVLSDLAPVINIDLGDRTSAAVINHPPLDVLRVAIRRSHRGALNGDAPYFNAGVLLLDTQRWQTRAVGARARAFISQYPATRLLDQDALNIALADDWCGLDKEWNAPAGPLEAAPVLGGMNRISPALLQSLNSWKVAQAAPKILHFTGRPKPWEENYPWPELRDLYRRFVDPDSETAWPTSNPQNVTSTQGEQRVREFWRHT